MREPTDFERTAVHGTAQVIRASARVAQPKDELDRTFSNFSGEGADHLDVTIFSRASDAIIKGTQVRAVFFDRAANSANAKQISKLVWNLDTSVEPSSTEDETLTFSNGKAPSEFVKVLVTATKVLPHSGKVETNQLRSE